MGINRKMLQMIVSTLDNNGKALGVRFFFWNRNDKKEPVVKITGKSI